MHTLCQTREDYRQLWDNIKPVRGLGDKVKDVFDKVCITTAFRVVERLTGKKCNCPKRQENLNKLFPYKE